MQLRWRPVAIKHPTAAEAPVSDETLAHTTLIYYAPQQRVVPCILEYNLGPGDVWYPVELQFDSRKPHGHN